MKTLRLAPHIHTEASDDSSWSLSRLVKVLSCAGFHGMLVSDHDRTMDADRWKRLQADCDRVADLHDFIIVPGVEYQDPDHIVHIPVFGRMSFDHRSPDIGQLLVRAHDHGAAAIFAHPKRRDAWERFSPDWAQHLAGIEVWNRKYDGVSPNTWAQKTAAELGLLPTVALDWHGPRQLFPLAIHVPVPAPGSNVERSEAVVASIVSGAARATALGVDVTRLHRGPVGALLRSSERIRQLAAPRIRRLESLFKPRS